MRRGGLVIVACTFAAVQSFPAGAQLGGAPTWAVDPARAGRDLPSVGRSLFDFAVAAERDGKPVYDVPFPFEALVKRIEERAGCAPRAPCVKQVLIPLGRSLQRTAASPEFFRYPRVVVAVDGEAAENPRLAGQGTPPDKGAGAPLLKDRLYLGYQERAALIEVISYNEAAGRFEFQIVRDYRPGGRPQVVYARRAVCAACHQNLAPIFSRQVWEETNANPRVAAALEQAHRRPAVKGGAERSEAGGFLYGVAVRRGVDIPNAIDAATDRANLLRVWQLLWREACGDGPPGAKCRAAALVAALQYRLTDGRAFDERTPEWREAFLPAFTREWQARWPGGLAIPNPDIPNRDPLPADGAPRPTGVPATHVAAILEPLAPRPPLEVWTVGEPETARRFVAGLAEFIAAADVRVLDAHLAGRAGRERPRERRYEAPCEMAWTRGGLRFRCTRLDEAAPDAARLAGRVELAGGRVASGELSALGVSGAAVSQHLEVRSGAIDEAAGRLRLELASRGMRARLADGAAIASVELRWDPGQVRARGGVREASGQATATAVDDFAPVRAAIAAMAADTRDGSPLSARPFARARVMPALAAKLGIPPRDWCCDDASLLPPAVVEPEEPPMPTAGPAKELAPFYPLCASCHATSERFPPNFLAGPGERVVESVKHCAVRIYARLAMWKVAPAAREKTPMPPPFASTQGTGYPPPATLAGLERAAAALLRAESGAAPQLERLLERGYEALRPCLAPER